LQCGNSAPGGTRKMDVRFLLARCSNREGPRQGVNGMPRFYFHIHNGNGFARDDEGTDAPDRAAAEALATKGIRSIVAEEALGGMIDLTGRVEIRDAEGHLLTTVRFAEAFELRTSG